MKGKALRLFQLENLFGLEKNRGEATKSLFLTTIAHYNEVVAIFSINIHQYRE